jgi:hypothetical protein
MTAAGNLANNSRPYSQKNVQACLCGAETCRGVLGPRSVEQRPSSKVASGKNGARTPSLSPKKKLQPKQQTPVRPNAVRRHTAPAVAPTSRTTLATQQKSRADRALNRSKSDSSKTRRKKVVVPAARLTKRQKSLKTANAVAAREKQIRRTVSEIQVSKVKSPAKVVAANTARTVQSKQAPVPKPTTRVPKATLMSMELDISDDPFDFPTSPTSSLRSRRQSKPSPKALENSMFKGKTRRQIDPVSAPLRLSLSKSVSKHAAKRTISTPLTSAVSTPTSRVSKRAIVPSPKVRENADTNSALGGSNKLLSKHLNSGGKNATKQRIDLTSSLAAFGKKLGRRPLANKDNA